MMDSSHSISSIMLCLHAHTVTTSISICLTDSHTVIYPTNHSNTQPHCPDSRTWTR